MNHAASDRSRILWPHLALLLFLLRAEPAPGATPAELVAQGERAFEKGAFTTAATAWEQALDSIRRAGNPDDEVRTAVALAGAYQALGQHRRAIQTLETALNRARQSGDPARLSQVQGRLGAALVLTRDDERAASLLREALQQAEATGNSGLAASILADQAALLALQEKHLEALAAYEKCLSLARQAADRSILTQALGNAAAAAARAGDATRAWSWNSRALEEINRLAPSHARAFLLITAAQTDRQTIPIDAARSKELTLRAHQSLRQALEWAEEAKDRQIETYALGYLAELYEADQQIDAALGLAHRATFAAQEGQWPEALYRWEWLAGRLLKTQGSIEPAAAAYRRSLDTLQSIRNDVSLGYGNARIRQPFRQSEGPLFLELADILLRQAATTTDPTREQSLLREARDTVEQLKNVELASYFCDDCVDAQRSKVQAVEAVDPETAVLYLIPLPDRTELLVGLNRELRRFTVGADSETLAREVREFRRNLETRTTYAYLEQAQRLYDWLIRPIRPLLARHGIHTLVFVPDGAIRTIPFASLHDGERFLIEDLAVAVAPGLSMVDPRPIARGDVRLLLNGLSEPVQGFAPLNFVTGELQNIERTYPGDKLLNQSFTLGTLQRKFSDEQYSIVHIASHGQFSRDVRNTFVLTYDSKLTLNDLEALIRPSQYRGRPVELLVLSACQTAAGDDRAALGLAGVAVKAGARSALATLWFVNDQSTAALITEVYQQLARSPRVSKARAVQAAQIKLLADRRYRHPCYWSPYLIIGNWL